MQSSVAAAPPTPRSHLGCLGTTAPQDNPRRRVQALGGDARFAGQPGHLGRQGIYLVAAPDDIQAARDAFDN